MNAKRQILFLFLIFISRTLIAQHYVGVKDAYGIMGISASPGFDRESLLTAINPGIAYRYEHKKYFAVQAEFNYISKGYIDKKNIEDGDWTQKIFSYELPVMAQAFVRFGWFRPYVAGGAFVGYINKRKVEINGKSYSYPFDDNDRRFEYGILGGAGMAFSISRFELQTEWRYQFAFSFLRNPHINEVSQYYNTTQMMISLTLFYRLTK